jgi:Na+-transporting NADH:ubiquinone oxidoreductase, subunit NqrA
MSQVIKIKKGLDIVLVGKARLSVQNIDSEYYAIQPTDFTGILPKLLVGEGDAVKAGTPLFYDKHNEKVVFTSPVSGTISEIRRGEKRLLEAIVIYSDKKYESIDFGIDKLEKNVIINKLLQSGLWPLIKQRPFSIIANPEDKPKAFFISAFDSSPLAPDMDFVIEHHPDSFQKGLEVLSILCDGKLHLDLHEQKRTPTYS